MNYVHTLTHAQLIYVWEVELGWQTETNSLWLYFRKEERRRVSLCCFVSVLPLHFSQHHFPSVCVCHSICNSSGVPVSWFEKSRLYVLKSVWLFSSFLYDIRALSYTQHKAAHDASFIASFRPRQLSFSRPAPTLCKYLCPPVHPWACCSWNEVCEPQCRKRLCHWPTKMWSKVNEAVHLFRHCDVRRRGHDHCKLYLLYLRRLWWIPAAPVDGLHARFHFCWKSEICYFYCTVCFSNLSNPPFK